MMSNVNVVLKASHIHVLKYEYMKCLALSYVTLRHLFQIGHGNTFIQILTTINGVLIAQYTTGSTPVRDYYGMNITQSER
jgi:hypothetical protein